MSALSLEEAFQSAKKRAPSLGAESSKAEAAGARLTQARAAFSPVIKGLGSYGLQDSGGVPGRSPESLTARLNLTQDLTLWGGKLGLLQAAADLDEAARLRTRDAELALYRGLSRAYFSAAAEEADKIRLLDQLKLNEERVAEMTRRERLGRSRKAELASAKAQLAFAKGAVAAQEALRIAARESLSTFTGLDQETPLDWNPASAPGQGGPSLAALLPKLSSNPRLKALSLEAKAARALASASQSHWLPSLDAAANYYAKRPSPLENSLWDLTLNLSWPFFSGFGDSARSAEAEARARQAGYEAEAERQSLEAELRSLARRLELKQGEITALAEAALEAEKAYDEQRKDYHQNLSSSLELTQAMQSYVDALRRLDRAKAEQAAGSAELKALTGEF